MKVLKYLMLSLLAGSAISCSQWTEEERLTYPDQSGLRRAIPMIEMTSIEELTPAQQKYYEELRAWKQTPHVRGFGWFGGWTARGTDPQKYLRMTPDSVDIISLWGTQGNLTEAQREDLKFVQQVKGTKVLLCWIVQNLGDQLTPSGREPLDYWVTEKGGGDFLEGVKAYANAICDTIDKYNLDGFDIDYEPGYGHSGDLALTPAWWEDEPGSEVISPAGNVGMYTFVKTLYDRLNPQGKIIVFDGEPYYMNRETSKMVSYYIYQAYDEETTEAALQKIEGGGTYGDEERALDDWEGKSFLTLEFQKYAKTGGFPTYISSIPEVQRLDAGRQIMDYALMILPNGKRIAGIGTYHMELDMEGGNYRFLREALAAGNRVSATQSAPFQ